MDIWQHAWLKILKTVNNWGKFSAEKLDMTEQVFHENLVMSCMQEPDI